ncbi:MAG: class I SAM-dependent rRNA methyltransferase [Deltaproteobacteria bacterium]|nr:class I SAM-dependent rRNA methyltransferase [Deltaproteobacteria bacterium]
MISLKLKANQEYRYKQYHPWGFIDDFEKIPDSISANQVIEVRDSKNQFISRGYANLKSQIFYRALTFDSREFIEAKQKFIEAKVFNCWKERKALGYQSSCRICFSENDYLPGLIIDYFQVSDSQVFTIQILTMGMNNLLTDMMGFVKEIVKLSLEHKISNISWEKTGIVVRNDSKIREKEGLMVTVPQVLKEVQGINLKDCQIILDHFFLEKKFSISTNLNEGQKTGFFLDQSYNLLRTAELFKNYLVFHKPEKIKVLDVCCYLGQWSVYMGLILKELNIEAEFVLLDISQDAINKAKTNLDRYGIKHSALIMDVLEKDFDFNKNEFDLIIVDPPAFVKNKKSLPTGKHAYQKLNSKVIPFLKERGLLVSCSCSGLLSMEDFRICLQKAFTKAYVKAKCVAQGGHAPDHPFLLSFPEGYYLKMLLHVL